MPDAPLLRIGGWSAVAGSVLAVVVNALHPRNPTTDRGAVHLRMVVEHSGLWVADYLGILLAVLLSTAGLLAVQRSITDEPGASWARLGAAGALLSAGILCVLAATDGIAVRALALAWAAAPEAEKAMAVRAGHVVTMINLALLAVWTVVFFGLTILLYGLALVTSRGYPRWMGWVAVAAGSGSLVVGAVQAHVGPSVAVTNVAFAVLSLTATLWMLGMGVLLLRRRGRAAPA
jgi:hypothetical protein